MERAERTLTVREAVMLVIDAAGGTVAGRTAVQKLCYFAGLSINQDLGHRAHYYGPYSRKVEEALINESFAGDLVESVRTFESGQGRDGKAYTYETTPQGAALVVELRANHPGPGGQIDEIVQRLGEQVPGYAQHSLSLAAKVDLILRQRHNEPAAAEEIPDLARQLGWQVTDHDVEHAVEILLGLGRVEETQAA